MLTQTLVAVDTRRRAVDESQASSSTAAAAWGSTTTHSPPWSNHSRIFLFNKWIEGHTIRILEDESQPTHGRVWKLVIHQLTSSSINLSNLLPVLIALLHDLLHLSTILYVPQFLPLSLFNLNFSNLYLLLWILTSLFSVSGLYQHPTNQAPPNIEKTGAPCDVITLLYFLVSQAHCLP